MLFIKTKHAIYKTTLKQQLNDEKRRKLKWRANRLIFLGGELSLMFGRLSPFNCCSLKWGITPKIRMLCFVLINSVLLNLLCVWTLL